jgi:NAD(P)-dependent dehydrogenase (short-subunit alcohol dehydrogenase family)
MDAVRARTIVVVGAAGGIGLEVLRQLHADDVQVIAVVQNLAQAEQVAAQSLTSVVCDLTNSDSVKQTLAAIALAAPERLDGLVFCAAMQPVGPLEFVPRADLERLFAVNVFGTLQVVQGLIPSLRRCQGRIVLFSSLAGRIASPMLGAYASSKFCLEGMSDALRRELRLSQVSLTLIEPGAVATPMATAQPQLVEQAFSRLDSASALLYGPMFRGYSALAQKGVSMASSAADVAAIAVAVVTGRAPAKPRYIAGRDAKLLIGLARLLPIRWLDALLMKLTLAK